MPYDFPVGAPTPMDHRTPSRAQRRDQERMVARLRRRVHREELRREKATQAKVRSDVAALRRQVKEATRG